MKAHALQPRQLANDGTHSYMSGMVSEAPNSQEDGHEPDNPADDGRPTADPDVTDVMVDDDVSQDGELEDVGPDPVLGVGLWALGLLVMAFGGATDRHIMFNVGTGLLLLGVVVFLAQVAMTSHKRNPITVASIRAAIDEMRGDGKS